MDKLMEEIISEQSTIVIGNTNHDLIKFEHNSDIVASERDPLGLDGFFSELPYLNKEGCDSLINDLLVKVIPDLTCLYTLDLVNAKAALRDLGHIAAFLRQQGVQVNDIISVQRKKGISLE
jgi:hypothetical protein